MVPPRVLVEDGMGGRRLARSFSRSAAAERLARAAPFFARIYEFAMDSLGGGAAGGGVAGNAASTAAMRSAGGIVSIMSAILSSRSLRVAYKPQSAA